MRASTVNLRPYKDRNFPHLKFVVHYPEGGKRRRKFFESKAQAGAWVALKNAELQRHGIEHTEFPAALRVMAQTATDELAPFGKTIADAAAHYLAHLKATEKSITVAELVPQMIAAKKGDGMSPRYLRDLRDKLLRFAAAFGPELVAAIAAQEIDAWLRSLPVGATTRNNFRRVLVTFFSHAIALGYAVANPAAKIALAKEVDAPPGILTVAQAANLLEQAPSPILPHLAIGLFAGLRRAELERLDWADVHFADNLIEVTAAKSKTARRRFVRISPNLRAWLAPVRKASGPITPANFVKMFRALRIAAGLTDWPANALRHSFASYHLAHFKDAAALALEMGHTDSGMIFAHYRQLVRPKEAERYWSLRPQAAADRKIVPID